MATRTKTPTSASAQCRVRLFVLAWSPDRTKAIIIHSQLEDCVYVGGQKTSRGGKRVCACEREGRKRGKRTQRRKESKNERARQQDAGEGGRRHRDADGRAIETHRGLDMPLESLLHIIRLALYSTDNLLETHNAIVDLLQMDVLRDLLLAA